jgi:hypothetical protein
MNFYKNPWDGGRMCSGVRETGKTPGSLKKEILLNYRKINDRKEGKPCTVARWYGNGDSKWNAGNQQIFGSSRKLVPAHTNQYVY